MVTLPLVLPPSVLGFYLLIVMGPQGPLGQFTQSMGWGVLSFTFTGLLIGSILFSLPFAVQPLQHAFDAIGSRPMEVAATLRASPLDAFLFGGFATCQTRHGHSGYFEFCAYRG
jgi:molybdate transport system permease protein